MAAPIRPLRTPTFERGAFVLLLVVLSLAFVVLLLPFFGTVLWAVALALLFTPLYRRIADRFGGRKTLAALATVLVCVVLVVLPLTIIGILIVQDVLELSARINSGELGYAAKYQRLLQASPQWLDTLLQRCGAVHDSLGDLCGVGGGGGGWRGGSSGRRRRWSCGRWRRTCCEVRWRHRKLRRARR